MSPLFCYGLSKVIGLFLAIVTLRGISNHRAHGI